MKIFRGHQQFIPQTKPIVATVGNFDGVHSGHREIIWQVIQRAKELGGLSLVYTFDPHPVRVLYPSKPLDLICSTKTKLKRFEEIGVDLVINEVFSSEFSKTTAHSFFHDILKATVGIKGLFVGYNFSFGKGREGSTDHIIQMGKDEGIPVTIVPPVTVH